MTKIPEKLFIVLKHLGHEQGAWIYTNVVAAKMRVMRTGGNAYKIDTDKLEEVEL